MKRERSARSCRTCLDGDQGLEGLMWGPTRTAPRFPCLLGLLLFAHPTLSRHALRCAGSDVATAIVSAFRSAARRSPARRVQKEARRGDAQGAAARHWRRARQLKTQVVVARRWHSDVNRGWKRMLLACKGSHTLIAGVFCRGSMGYTRAQTCVSMAALQPLPPAHTPAAAARASPRPSPD